MDMKRLEISRLMDEYQDNEFFPEGGSIADTQTVKERVLAQAAPVKKRRMPPLTKVLIAAALAVGCLTLSVMADLPQRVYGAIVGGTVVAEPVQLENGFQSTQYTLTDVNWDCPIVLEGGRLWLTIDGTRTDITDLIDEETPYIVSRTFPENNSTAHLVVGGTPEDFGFVQYIELDEGIPLDVCSSRYWTDWLFTDGHGYSEDSFTTQDWDTVDQLIENHIRKDSLWYKFRNGDASEEERLELARLNNRMGGTILVLQYRPWVVNAREQLGFFACSWGLSAGHSDYQRTLFNNLSDQKGGQFSLEDMEIVSKGEWDPLLFSN